MKKGKKHQGRSPQDGDNSGSHGNEGEGSFREQNARRKKERGEKYKQSVCVAHCEHTQRKVQAQYSAIRTQYEALHQMQESGAAERLAMRAAEEKRKQAQRKREFEQKKLVGDRKRAARAAEMEAKIERETRAWGEGIPKTISKKLKN